MRITFIPHCGIDDESLGTWQIDDDVEGMAKVRELWDTECDAGLDYRAVADIRIKEFERNTAEWAALTVAEQAARMNPRVHVPDEELAKECPLDLTFATDYGYIVVNHW